MVFGDWTCFVILFVRVCVICGSVCFYAFWRYGVGVCVLETPRPYFHVSELCEEGVLFVGAVWRRCFICGSVCCSRTTSSTRPCRGIPRHPSPRRLQPVATHRTSNPFSRTWSRAWWNEVSGSSVTETVGWTVNRVGLLDCTPTLHADGLCLPAVTLKTFSSLYVVAFP